jgi:hypothetical protein
MTRVARPDGQNGPVPDLKVGPQAVETSVTRDGSADAMGREVRRDKETAPVEDDARFEHSSRHADLESLLADHMVDPEAPTMAEWLPSRRGNSPRPAPRSAE